MGNIDKLTRGLAIPLPNTYPDPPTIFKFQGRLLMVDQAVAKSGWVILDFLDNTFCELDRGMWQAAIPIKGHRSTLEMAACCFHYFENILLRNGIDQVVHEMPPVGGGMVRPESSLIAATTLWCASYKFGISIDMMGAQKAKKRWTGYANATKTEVRQAVLKPYPQFAKSKPWNQDICDAVALGLTWAEINKGV